MIGRPASILSPLTPFRLGLSAPTCTKCSSAPSRRAGARGRPFSHSTTLLSTDNPQNHYEVLRMPVHATQAELKRQFYVLSKETHPDINPRDPNAGKRFAQISESYSVLADPEKRKRYDRDVMRGQHHHSHHRHHGQRSQHGGGTYAGHRPASGLSKRRSAFKGPPPSFYAHGRPSPNTQAHAEAHARASHQTGSSGPSEHMGGTFNAGAYTNEGGPAFDSRSTYKTQTHEDYRRMNRRAAELAAAQAEVRDDNFWGRFVAVSGVIIFGVTMGSVAISRANTAPRGGLTRADGSRRDSATRNEWTKG